MENWTERIESHEVHKALEDLAEALNTAESKGEDTEEVPGAVGRLRHVVELAQRTLSSIDPLLTGKATLDSMNKVVGLVLGQVNQYASTDTVAHLDNANIEADKLLPMLGSLIKPSAPEDIEGLRSALSGFERAAKNAIDDVRGQADEAKESATSLAEDVAALQKTIENEKSRIDQAVAQYQKQFSEAQETRQRTFDTALKERMEEFATFLTSSKEKQEELEADASKKTDELLKDIEERRDKAKEIVGIIAGTGMAGGYQKDADQQRNAFLFWNIATIVGFAGLIGFSVWLFVATTKAVAAESFQWSEVGARFIVILAFGLFAAYAGRMAMKHRDSEREHRHKQLALESLNSFLEDLDPEVQKQVKAKVADAFFVRHARTLTGGDEVAPTTIQEVVNAINRLRK